MKFVKNEEGITLIELMIAIALIGVVIAAIYMTYFTAVRIFGFNQDAVEFHRDQRLISESIGKYIRSANKIDIIDGNELLIEYKEGTEKVGFYNKNDYFYVDNDPDDVTKGERQISQLKLNSLTFSNYGGIGIINTEITLLNDNNDTYTFLEQFNPRIKDVNIVETP